MNKKGQISSWVFIIIAILFIWGIISSVGWSKANSSLNKKIKDCEKDKLQLKSLYQDSLDNLTKLTTDLKNEKDLNKNIQGSLRNCQNSLEKFNFGGTKISPITTTYVFLSLTIFISFFFLVYLFKIKFSINLK